MTFAQLLPASLIKMTQSHESPAPSLQLVDLGDGTVLMWQKTIEGLAPESSVSAHPRQCLHIRTIRPYDCSPEGQRSTDDGLQKMLYAVSERYSSGNSNPEVAYLALPLNPGPDRRCSQRQSYQQGARKTEESEMYGTLDLQAAIVMPLEHINVLFNQTHRPAKKDHFTTSTPLPSHEPDESVAEMNGSVLFPDVQHTVRTVSEDREQQLWEIEDCSSGRISSGRENHINISKEQEERLTGKELELQQLVHLLLKMQRELTEARAQSHLKDAAIGLLAENLKLEEKRHKELAALFDNTYSALRTKLLASKADNRSFVKQLRQLLEKYEKLKTCAAAAKGQSRRDRADKEHAIRTLNEAKLEWEKLNAEQSLMKTNGETAQRAASELKEKLESLESCCQKNVRDKQRLEDELSTMKSETEYLRDQLQTAQNESLRLVKCVSSIESAKEVGAQQLLESQKQVNVLKLKLEEYRTERESLRHQIKATRQEAKRSQDKLNEELHLVQENFKACEKTAGSMQIEAATLSKRVLDLKRDKKLLKVELENLHQGKEQLESKSQQESTRLRDVITVLEKERDLLQMELGDLRKDYLNMSDRIAKRMSNLDQDVPHTCISDSVSICKEASSLQDRHSLQYTDDKEDVILQIKRRLENEEAR